jgi:hypothetical protein
MPAASVTGAATSTESATWSSSRNKADAPPGSSAPPGSRLAPPSGEPATPAGPPRGSPLAIFTLPSLTATRCDIVRTVALRTGNSGGSPGKLYEKETSTRIRNLPVFSCCTISCNAIAVTMSAQVKGTKPSTVISVHRTGAAGAICPYLRELRLLFSLNLSSCDCQVRDADFLVAWSPAAVANRCAIACGTAGPGRSPAAVRTRPVTCQATAGSAGPGWPWLSRISGLLRM